MTNYDTMTVHDLVLEAAKDGMQGFLHDASPELCELPEIESALRRAVIRESTISTVTVTTTEHYDELCRPTDPDRICTMSSTYTYSQWVPEGEYSLCKKESVETK
jgi:hypothetical protein